MRSISETSKKSIVCVRHGETVWKLEGRTQGQMDSPLTDMGICQVYDLAKKLETETFGLIISSPLGRTLQTAEILSRKLGIADVRKSNYLIEQYEGSFQGLTRVQQKELFPECFDAETDRVIPDKIPGIEPTAQFLSRVSAGLREIASFANDTGVLAVTHAGVLQAMSALITGEDFDKISTKRSFGFCDALRFDLSQIKKA